MCRDCCVGLARTARKQKSNERAADGVQHGKYRTVSSTVSAWALDRCLLLSYLLSCVSASLLFCFRSCRFSFSKKIRRMAMQASQNSVAASNGCEVRLSGQVSHLFIHHFHSFCPRQGKGKGKEVKPPSQLHRDSRARIHFEHILCAFVVRAIAIGSIFEVVFSDPRGRAKQAQAESKKI